MDEKKLRNYREMLLVISAVITPSIIEDTQGIWDTDEVVKTAVDVGQQLMKEIEHRTPLGE